MQYISERSVNMHKCAKCNYRSTTAYCMVLGVLDELLHSSSLVESGRQQISRRYVFGRLSAFYFRLRVMSLYELVTGRQTCERSVCSHVKSTELEGTPPVFPSFRKILF